MKHLIALGGVILLGACSSDSETSNEIIADSEQEINLSIEALNLEEGEERIFVLPAPLQVATALNLYSANYDHTLLSEVKTGVDLHSKYGKAMSLGAYVIDLGYAAVNNQGEDALGILDGILSISKDLGVQGYDKNLIERFRQNKDNPDSLSFLILTGYELAHEYVRQNRNEDLALSILTGSWVEGMYLSCQYPELVTNPKYYELVAQQKYYLENLIILMSRFEEEEVQDIVYHLKRIYIMFDSIEAIPDMTATDLTVPDGFQEEMLAISAELNDFRSTIINGQPPI